jgi:predicted GNAT family acetyltransferase
VWQELITDPGFVPQHGTREVLYALELLEPASPCPDGKVRTLRPDEFPAWDVLNGAFCSELNLPREPASETRRARFSGGARQGQWWGAFEDAELTSIAALNAVYSATGQVGGVYTARPHRRQGRSRAMMRQLIADAIQVHQLTRLILFTGEDNEVARRMYESLGFTERGAYALLLGTRASRSVGPA